MREIRNETLDNLDSVRTITSGRVRSGGNLTGGQLDLPRVPWEGANYFDQFPRASASGWGSPDFFPFAVWLSDLTFSDELVALGINTFQASYNPNPANLDQAIADGMFLLANVDIFTPTDVGDRDGVVGWFVHDEPDLNFATVAAWQAEVDAARALDDGRFVCTNFSVGVVPVATVGWQTNDMEIAVPYVDTASCDEYAYASPHVRNLLTGGAEFLKPPNWPGPDGDAAVARASGSYGWMMDQFHLVDDGPSNKRPLWIFVETKCPLTGDAEPTPITHDELEGAVWNAICHEARGVSYFQQNNAPAPDCTNYWSLLDCEQGLKDKVTLVNGQIAALASVINTQSYVFDFGAAGITTMLKAKDGYAYIFSCVDLLASTGSKTFTVTGSGITGTNVEVVNESRNLTISGGQFSDTFANEYTHHIYKVAI